MSNGTSLSEYQVLADRLMDLPSKIVQNHSLEHLPQIVLHYLGHSDCFGLEKAAYFANSPDFNYLLGAAGYCDHECCYKKAEDIWQDPYKYNEHMGDAKFHKCIKKIIRDQVVSLDDPDSLSLLASELDMKNPKFLLWNLKHGNHGVLIYNTKNSMDQNSLHLLKRSMSFFGFCPI